MRLGFVELLLGPLLLAQGRRVRRRTPRLPEPDGPREGAVGSGPHVRILVAGDSAAAGVGADSWDETLTARLVARLEPSLDVAWRLEAGTGATTLDTVERLMGLRGERFDVLVTSLGVNDLTRGVALPEWLRRQRRLREVAREQLGVALQLVAGLPPVDGFPALPQPLRWYLGGRARAFTAALARDLNDDGDTRFIDLRVSDDVSWMASDGFHPGPRVYDAWAGKLATEVLSSQAIGSRVARPTPIFEASGGAVRSSRGTSEADRIMDGVER